MKLMKILVALDGSRWAGAALPKVVELVKENDGARRRNTAVMAGGHRDDAGRLVPGPIARFVLHRSGRPVLLVAETLARRAMAQDTEIVRA